MREKNFHHLAGGKGRATPPPFRAYNSSQLQVSSQSPGPVDDDCDGHPLQSGQWSQAQASHSGHTMSCPLQRE